VSRPDTGTNKEKPPAAAGGSLVLGLFGTERRGAVAALVDTFLAIDDGNQAAPFTAVNARLPLEHIRRLAVLGECTECFHGLLTAGTCCIFHTPPHYIDLTALYRR